MVQNQRQSSYQIRLPEHIQFRYTGTGSGTFKITSTTCIEKNHDEEPRGHHAACDFDSDDKIISQSTVTGVASLGMVGQTSYTLNSGGTLAPEVPVALTLNSDSTSTPISPTNYFTVSYTVGGVVKTANAAGGLLTLQVDPNTTVTISGIFSSSNFASEEWCFTSDCAPVSVNSGASGGSLTLVYYDLLAQGAQDSIVGGGTPTVSLSHTGDSVRCEAQ